MLGQDHSITATPDSAKELGPIEDLALVLLREGEDRRRFPLASGTPGCESIIGRREDCDLRIPLGDVSRKHCSILLTDDGGLRLQDLGSSNGTYVNGRRVQESPILPGDVIQIGSLKFLVQVNHEPPEPDAIPSRRSVAADDDVGQAPHLNPTSTMDAADGGLDPSDAARHFDELLGDD